MVRDRIVQRLVGLAVLVAVELMVVLVELELLVRDMLVELDFQGVLMPVVAAVALV